MLEMAFRTVFRTVLSTEPWRPLPSNRSSFSTPIVTHKSSILRLSCGCRIGGFGARDFHLAQRIRHLNCSHNETPSSSEPYPEDHDQDPPQEAVLKAISEVSKTEGRVGQTTNVVIGGTVTDDTTNEWLALDQKVNSYPTVRGFTAIGTGGDDFVQAMVVAVESVLQQPIPEGEPNSKKHMHTHRELAFSPFNEKSLTQRATHARAQWTNVTSGLLLSFVVGV